MNKAQTLLLLGHLVLSRLSVIKELAFSKLSIWSVAIAAASGSLIPEELARLSSVPVKTDPRRSAKMKGVVSWIAEVSHCTYLWHRTLFLSSSG